MFEYFNKLGPWRESSQEDISTLLNQDDTEQNF